MERQKFAVRLRTAWVALEAQSKVVDLMQLRQQAVHVCLEFSGGKLRVVVRDVGCDGCAVRHGRRKGGRSHGWDLRVVEMVSRLVP
jgi:hypothetical protein